MPILQARHNEILNQAIEAHNGFVFRVIGDSFSAAFHDAIDALHAALDSQRLLHNSAVSSVESTIHDMRRRTRKKYSAEKKVQIVLEGSLFRRQVAGQ